MLSGRGQNQPFTEDALGTACGITEEATNPEVEPDTLAKTGQVFQHALISTMDPGSSVTAGRGQKQVEAVLAISSQTVFGEMWASLTRRLAE